MATNSMETGIKDKRVGRVYDVFGDAFSIKSL